jgi:hypothetical protein
METGTQRHSDGIFVQEPVLKKTLRYFVLEEIEEYTRQTRKKT